MHAEPLIHRPGPRRRSTSTRVDAAPGGLWTPRAPGAPLVERVQCMPPGIGYSFGVGGRSAKKAGFDPATLTLSGWWRSDGNNLSDRGYYIDAAPSGKWFGTASAGTSSGKYLYQTLSSYPAAGAAINGHVPPSSEAALSILSADDGGFTSADFASNSGFSFWALVKINQFVNDNAAPNGDCIFEDVGEAFGLNLRSSTTAASFYVHSLSYTSASVTVTTGTWYLLQGVWDGSSSVSLRANGGAWQTQGGASMSAPSNSFRTFVDDGSNWTFRGIMPDLGFSKQVWSTTDTVWNNLRTYCNTRYGVSV